MTCDGCGQPIKDGEAVWFKASTAGGSATWHEQCAPPEVKR